MDGRKPSEDEEAAVNEGTGTADGTAGGEETAAESVAVLGGTGPLGRGLAVRLAIAGHDVRLGSRSLDRAEESVEGLLERIDGSISITPAENERTLEGAGIVVVAVPFEGQAPTLSDLGEAIGDRIVVNAVNPLGFDESGPHVIPTEHGSASEDCAARLPQARVVAAFKAIPARRLLDIDDPVGCDVLVAGDDDGAVDRIVRLAGSLDGARAFTCGPLRASRYLETLTPLLIGVNRRYRAHAGIRLVGIAEGTAD